MIVFNVIKDCRFLFADSQILALEENAQTASGKGPCGKVPRPCANTHESGPSEDWKPLGQ